MWDFCSGNRKLRCVCGQCNCFACDDVILNAEVMLSAGIDLFVLHLEHARLNREGDVIRTLGQGHVYVCLDYAFIFWLYIHVHI